MGGCLQGQSMHHQNSSKVRLEPKVEQRNKYQLSLRSTDQIGTNFRIRNQPSSSKLQFSNAPLINCEYLYNKFHHDNHRPDQINLQWQIQKIQIMATNQERQKQIKLFIINRLPVNLWIVVGGTQEKNMTGLYLNIHKYQFCHQQQIPAQSNLTNQISSSPYIFYIPDKIKCNKFFVILQSISNPQQSLCLINSYQTNQNEQRNAYYNTKTQAHSESLINSKISRVKLVKQELMWNSLAFQIGDIYNQEQNNLNEQVNQESYCVICRSEMPNCILVPCKHMCLCKQCVSIFKRSFKACPLCKKQYTQIIVYNQVKK